jgi:hypothetical protein
MIIDKRLAQHRIAEYNRRGDSKAIDLEKQGLDCKFDHFNNTLDADYGEDGVFCEEKTYLYKSTYSTSADHGRFNVIYEHAFALRGAKNELITYWYEMLIGINFLASSSLKVMIARND